MVMLLLIPHSPGTAPAIGPAQYLHAGELVTAVEVPDAFTVPNGRTVLAGTLQDAIAAGVLIPAPLPLPAARAKRLREISAAFARLVSAGIEVDGVRLAAGDTDRNAFAQLLVMLREAEALSALPATVTIADAAGELHTMPTADARALLVRYGSTYHDIWTATAAARNAVTAAADSAAVDAVPLPTLPTP